MSTQDHANKMMGAAYLRQGQLALGARCYESAKADIPKELLVECGHIALRKKNTKVALDAFIQAGAQSALREFADDCLASSFWSQWLDAKRAYEALEATDKLGELGKKWMATVQELFDEGGPHTSHAGKSPSFPIECLKAAQLYDELKTFGAWLAKRQDYDNAIDALQGAKALDELVKLGDKLMHDDNLKIAEKAYGAAIAIERLKKLIGIYSQKSDIKAAVNIVVALCTHLSVEALTTMIDPILASALRFPAGETAAFGHISRAFEKIAEAHPEQ